MSDCVTAADSVVGEQVWLVLLSDLYEGPAQWLPIAELKASKPPECGVVTGGFTLERLIERVEKADMCPSPLAFDIAKKMVVQAEKDPCHLPSAQHGGAKAPLVPPTQGQAK